MPLQKLALELVVKDWSILCLICFVTIFGNRHNIPSSFLPHSFPGGSLVSCRPFLLPLSVLFKRGLTVGHTCSMNELEQGRTVGTRGGSNGREIRVTS